MKYSENCVVPRPRNLTVFNFTALLILLATTFPATSGFGSYASGNEGVNCFYYSCNDTAMYEVAESETNRQRAFPGAEGFGRYARVEGITLANAGLYVQADHVVIRYIRARMGDLGKGEFPQNVRIASGRNIILDHVTASWGINETLSTSSPLHHAITSSSLSSTTSPAYYSDSDRTDIDSVTVQWSMITESLYDSYDPKGRRAYGGVIRGRRETHHHNLYAHHNIRNPKIAWRAHSLRIPGLSTPLIIRRSVMSERSTRSFIW